MGIDARLEGENGGVIESLLDVGDVFADALGAQDLSGTVCLRFIDPYGDTSFNGRQLAILISELNALASRLPSVQARAHVRKVVAMGEAGMAEPHRYLKFYGD